MDSTIKIGEHEFETYITETEIQSRVNKIAEEICSDFRDKNPVLIVILNGAFVFAADLVRSFDFACEIYFIKLSSYDGMRSSGGISVNKLEDIAVTNRHVIIIEDIIDTGNTMAEYIPLLQEDNPMSVCIASLLLKKEAHKHFIDVKYGGFDIPDKFVIGYGLDFNGHGRNLKHIYQLKE